MTTSEDGTITFTDSVTGDVVMTFTPEEIDAVDILEEAFSLYDGFDLGLGDGEIADTAHAVETGEESFEQVVEQEWDDLRWSSTSSIVTDVSDDLENAAENASNWFENACNNLYKMYTNIRSQIYEWWGADKGVLREAGGSWDWDGIGSESLLPRDLTDEQVAAYISNLEGQEAQDFENLVNQLMEIDDEIEAIQSAVIAQGVVFTGLSLGFGVGIGVGLKKPTSSSQ